MTPPRFVLPTIFALAVAVSSSARLAAERVEHPAAGIALDRPAGWHTATLAQVHALFAAGLEEGQRAFAGLQDAVEAKARGITLPDLTRVLGR